MKDSCYFLGGGGVGWGWGSKRI